MEVLWVIRGDIRSLDNGSYEGNRILRYCPLLLS